MSTVEQCDHCESVYAIKQAEPPYPLTITDAGGVSGIYCSAPCAIEAMSAAEWDRAYAAGVQYGNATSATNATRKRRWW